MRDSAGFLTFTSDPRNPDTDGDGLMDGEEIGERFAAGEGDGAVYAVFSDPRLADTDGDGLSDPRKPTSAAVHARTRPTATGSAT